MQHKFNVGEKVKVKASTDHLFNDGEEVTIQNPDDDPSGLWYLCYDSYGAQQLVEERDMYQDEPHTTITNQTL